MPTLSPKNANRTLWTAQIVLAALFLFAGGSKLVMSIEAMQQGPIVLPGAFIRFIGIAEVCGALGLVLPGLVRIRRQLTVVAASGLVAIMIGATVLMAVSGGFASALFPLLTGVMATGVAVGRRSWSTPALSLASSTRYQTLATR